MDKSIIVLLAVAGGGLLAYKFWLKPKMEQAKVEQKAIPATEQDAKMQVLETKIAAYNDDAKQKWDSFLKKRSS